MIKVTQKGNFTKTKNFLRRARKPIRISILEKYGQKGVAALSAATPIDSGETSNSWSYKIKQTKDSTSIQFYNTNIQNGIPIAIILQFGHATKNGGWISGRDYINPAIQPIFDKIKDDVWKEVIGL